MRCSGGRGVVVLYGSRTAASINATARCQARRGAAVDGASRERWHWRRTRIILDARTGFCGGGDADEGAPAAQRLDGASASAWRVRGGARARACAREGAGE